MRRSSSRRALHIAVAHSYVPWLAAILLIVGLAANLVRLRGQSAVDSTRNNVIIFVADGLRPSSVNEKDTPHLWGLGVAGVRFRDSYAVFPTVTMPNASTIATGHRLGDTGVTGNTVWLGHTSFDTGNFNQAPGSPLPFLENDQVLADLNEHLQGNLEHEETLLGAARAAGYNTAVVGKVGPVVLQDAVAVAPAAGDLPTLTPTIIVDDVTGTAAGIPLAPTVVARLRKENLPLEAPGRNNGFGARSPYNNGTSGTLAADVVQQQWFADVATRVVLPLFESQPAPFALVFWTRDPDGTQHNQGDSAGTLFPGINGPTSMQAVQNADRALGQLLGWLDAHPAIKARTDVVVTSDHGFTTASHREIDRTGRPTTSESARHAYFDVDGSVDTEEGTLPLGFLAIDLALDLRLNLFDPDRRVLNGGKSPYRRLRVSSGAWEHPSAGNGLLGDVVQKLDGSDAKVIVASNGGSDLLYLPSGDADLAARVVRALLTHDYVGGVFVADALGPVPGALPMSAIGLTGSGTLPRPDIVVAFKVFYFNPDDLRTGIQVADSALGEGQGVHGGFGRESTANTMMAVGPDFKRAFVDDAPVGNGDIAPTLAKVLGLRMEPKGMLGGRVIVEALVGGPDAPASTRRMLASAADGGMQTVLYYRDLGDQRYLEAACLMRPAVDRRSIADGCR